MIKKAKTTALFLMACLNLALAALPSGASASMIARDDFQSYNVGALTGNNGGTGWSGQWVTSAPIIVGVVNPVTDLQGDRAIAFKGNNDTAASRKLSKTVSGDVFVDFLIQFNGVTNDNDFLGLWFGNSNGPNIGLKGNQGTGTGTKDLFVRTGGTSGSWLSGSNITSGTTYHLFAHLYKSQANGNYNRFDAWLDPTSAEMSSLTGADAQFAGTSTISSFNQIGLRTANLDTDDTVIIDNLNLQSAPVPEPGTVMLLGFGMLGLVVYSKRRKNGQA